MFPLKGEWLQSLVEELRSHIQRSQINKSSDCFPTLGSAHGIHQPLLGQSPDASLPGGMDVGDGLHPHFSFSVHSSHCLVVAERRHKTLPARSCERSPQPHGLPTAGPRPAVRYTPTPAARTCKNHHSIVKSLASN